MWSARYFGKSTLDKVLRVTGYFLFPSLAEQRDSLVILIKHAVRTRNEALKDVERLKAELHEAKNHLQALVLENDRLKNGP